MIVQLPTLVWWERAVAMRINAQRFDDFIASLSKQLLNKYD